MYIFDWCEEKSSIQYNRNEKSMWMESHHSRISLVYWYNYCTFQIMNPVIISNTSSVSSLHALVLQYCLVMEATGISLSDVFPANRVPLEWQIYYNKIITERLTIFWRSSPAAGRRTAATQSKIVWHSCMIFGWNIFACWCSTSILNRYRRIASSWPAHGNVPKRLIVNKECNKL